MTSFSYVEDIGLFDWLESPCGISRYLKRLKSTLEADWEFYKLEWLLS